MVYVIVLLSPEYSSMVGPGVVREIDVLGVGIELLLCVCMCVHMIVMS